MSNTLHPIWPAKGTNVDALRAVMLFPTSNSMATEYVELCRARSLLSTVPELAKMAFEPIVNPPRPSMGAKATKAVAAEQEATSALRKKDTLLARGKLVNEIVTTYAHQPPADFELIARRSAIEGQVAGLCLHMFRVLDRGKYKTQVGAHARPSWNVVRYLCEEYNLGRNRRGAGRPQSGRYDLGNVDEKKIQKIWTQYRSVAHLWAASLVFTKDTFPSEPNWPFHVNVLEVWAIAWGYQAMAHRLAITSCAFGHVDISEPALESINDFSKETAETRLIEEDAIWHSLAESKVATYRAQ